MRKSALAACNTLASLSLGLSLSLPSALGKAKTNVGVDDRFDIRSLDPFATNFDTERALRRFVRSQLSASSSVHLTAEHNAARTAPYLSRIQPATMLSLHATTQRTRALCRSRRNTAGFSRPPEVER